jgi:hypothetical protein
VKKKSIALFEPTLWLEVSVQWTVGYSMNMFRSRRFLAKVPSEPVESTVQQEASVYWSVDYLESISTCRRVQEINPPGPVEPAPIGARRSCNNVNRRWQLESNG